MNTKFYIALLFFMLLSNANAQFSVSGKVIDADTKQALSQVEIFIADIQSNTLTNENGNFIIEHLKPSKYLISFSRMGFQSLVLNLDLKSDTTLEISLHFSVTEINEVVVTGVSSATSLRDNPLVITTLSAEELKNTVATNVIDALKNVPGVSQITTGPAISKPIIRGLGYNRVLTLYNGIRQEGQQWGDEHGIGIDRFSVSRVEIIKGPGSLMYGSDGIAGVVNFLPPKGLPMGNVKTQIATNYQSNNNLMAYSVMNAGNKNGFQWRGRFSNTFAGNYKNKYDGRVYNSGFKEFDGQLFLGINKRWGHSHLTISSYNNTLNLPEGDRDSKGNFIYENSAGEEVKANTKELLGFSVGIPHQKINHFKVISNNYFLLKKGSLKVDVAFQNNKRREYGNPANTEETELYFDLYTANINTVYNLPEMNLWKTAVGIGTMYQTNLNKGEEVLIPEYQMYDVGVFATTQRQFFKQLTFAAGLRFDSRFLASQPYFDATEKAIKFKSFNRNFYGISGSVGLSYRMSKSSTLKFNLSRGFRVPNLAELASNGRHEGTFRYEIGNRQLMPEYSNQIDLAYYLDTKHFSFSLSPFFNFVNNYVYAQKLSSVNGGDSLMGSEDPTFAYQYRQDEAILYGGEIYLDFHPHPLDWLHIANSFSLVYANQLGKTDSLKYLPFIPAPKYRAEVKAEFNDVAQWVSNIHFSVGFNYVLTQNRFFAAYNTETITPGYALLGAAAGIDFKTKNNNDFMSLLISVNNITNTAYQSHLNRLKYAPINPLTGRMGIFNMGRNVSIKLIFNI